jgi:aerobic C4-dicarboxylate transport protein
MVLTSKGAAGITGAGLVTLVASLQAFGGEFFTPQSIAIGIALVVGIDRVMSEGRALTNAIGNCVATMFIAKWQGERDDERFQAVLDDPGLADADVERATVASDEETAAPTDASADTREIRDARRDGDREPVSAPAGSQSSSVGSGEAR